MNSNKLNIQNLIAMFKLHAVGDTIGFNGGEWEFNGFSNRNISSEFSYVYEIIAQFVEKGGYSSINLKNWLVSDDTILHMLIAKSLIETLNESNIKNPDAIEIADKFSKLLIQAYDKHQFVRRYIGKSTEDSIKLMKNGKDWKTFDYRENYAIGSGASIRSLAIGAVFYGKSNREKLIQIALETSRTTHNNAIGFLGGITTALISAFIIEKIPLNLIPSELLKILNSNIIDDYIAKTRGIQNYSIDKNKFIDKWKRYNDDMFDEKLNIIQQSFKRNLMLRMEYYYRVFSYKSNEFKSFPGGGGDDSTIIAFDCLLDCEGIFEKLVYYSMLNVGDSDSIGCIAGGWFGLLYGFNTVNMNLVSTNEFNDELESLSNDIYKLSKLITH
jgi:ADP-ribosylarginine hydrolase